MATKYQSSVPLGEFTGPQFLMLVSNAFSKIGWGQQEIDNDAQTITAQTGMSAASWGEAVTVTIEGNEATILSKCTGTQLIDWGRNKKNVTLLRAS